MRFWFYVAATGVLTGDNYVGADLAGNTPEGCLAIEGVTDWQAQRVDLQTHELVAWQPPAPASDALQTWAWDSAVMRWTPVPTLAALKAVRLARLQQQIEAQEAAQARPVRELLAAVLSGGQADQPAKDAFAAVQATIAALRQTRALVDAAASVEALAAIPE